jgi:hypothetical protein
MLVFHEMIIASREVIVASAINRQNMAARLMDFLEPPELHPEPFPLKKAWPD